MKKSKKITSLLLAFVMLISTVLSVGVTAFAAATTTVSVTGTYRQTDARSMLSSINNFRTGKNAWYWNKDNKTKTTCKNLNKLKYSYELEKIAMQRAAEIAVKFGHTRPNGQSYKTAYSVNGYNAGENLAAGYRTIESAFKAWQETNEKYDGQGHRRCMLYSKYNTVGISHIVVNGVDYWVQEFSTDKNVGKATAANNKSTTVKVNVTSDYKPHAPTRISGEIGSTDIKVNWNSALFALGYQAECSTDKNFKNKKTVTTNGKTLTATFPNLKESTNYYIRLRSYRTYNGKKIYSNWTHTMNYTTRKATATPPKSNTTTSKKNSTTSSAQLTAPSINVYMKNNKSITFYWQQIDGVTGYQAQLSSNSKFTNARSYNATGSERKACFEGLNSSTAYYIRVRAYKTSGGKTTYSPWSQIKTIVTQ